jgi:hypothetical protein
VQSAGLATWQGEAPAEPGQRGFSVVTVVGDQYFLPLVSSKLKLAAELDVLFLRSGRAGVLRGQGDIDNRLKVLFDGLSVPGKQMAANAPCAPPLRCPSGALRHASRGR